MNGYEKVPRVFIPQEPMRKDTSGNWVPKMNLDKAGCFGDMIICLPPGRIPLSPEPTIMMLQDKLKDFCCDDFLVAVGPPAVIAVAAAICAAKNGGKFKLLVWNKDALKYTMAEWDCHPKEKCRAKKVKK